MADRPPIYYIVSNTVNDGAYNYICAIGWSPEQAERNLIGPCGPGVLFVDWEWHHSKFGAKLAVRKMARKKRKPVKSYRKTGVIK